ncbi:hypothetical protein ACVWXO_000539 [Bradyrhizobium sp. LM2.7]
MLGCKERGQLELFITGSLRQLVPDDHILVKVDRVLDLSWLRGEVAGLCCNDNGRPGIDPEAALRLMLAGFLLGVVTIGASCGRPRSTSRSAGSSATTFTRFCLTILP